MRVSLIVIASCLVACGSDEGVQAPLPAPLDPVPTTSGSYLGRYVVPAPAELAAAAVYRVDEVAWTVVGSTATLHYNLPDGLVGGRIDVTLSGTITPGATQLELTSPTAVGTCVAAGTVITCREVFGDLGTLPISMPVVQQVAARDYAGPPSERVAIANLFSSDPIGIVDFDLTVPAMDDHGGDDD